MGAARIRLEVRRGQIGAFKRVACRGWFLVSLLFPQLLVSVEMGAQAAFEEGGGGSEWGEALRGSVRSLPMGAFQ